MHTRCDCIKLIGPCSSAALRQVRDIAHAGRQVSVCQSQCTRIAQEHGCIAPVTSPPQHGQSVDVAAVWEILIQQGQKLQKLGAGSNLHVQTAWESFEALLVRKGL